MSIVSCCQSNSVDNWCMPFGSIHPLLFRSFIVFCFDRKLKFAFCWCTCNVIIQYLLYCASHLITSQGASFPQEYGCHFMFDNKEDGMVYLNTEKHGTFGIAGG